MSAFSRCQTLFMPSTRSRSSATSLTTATRRRALASSFSLLRACSSMASAIRRRSSWSMGSGSESISIFNRLAASSTRSMALSGSCRAEMYRSERRAAATRAASRMRIPWWISYRSFNPRKMATVSVTDGSPTNTGWNRRSRALSFSTRLRYSSSVVAPMQRSSPRARAGFSMFAASMAPSAPPAPTRVCSSSMNRMTPPAAAAISFSTAFSRSSNSPRNFVPAMSAPRSRARIFLSFSDSGTSPAAIRCAIPSATAVLPTPGSPISTGLFLVRRDSTCIDRRISSSRPITGSSFPARADSVRSRVYLAKASYFPSASRSVTR